MNWPEIVKKKVSVRLGAAALGAILLPVAATAAPWFGQPLPPPTNDPNASVVQTTGDDLPAAPAKFGPGPKSPLLNGERIKDDLKTIVGFSLKSKADGAYLWGRVTGTPAYYAAVSWAVNELKAAGLTDAHLENFTTTLTIPTAGEARLLGDASYGDGTQDVVLQSAMVGGRGPVNGSVTAPLIYVGHATAADMVGRDVKGKIAVLHTTVNPGLYSADEIGRPAELIKAGAVGTIEILDQVGNMQSYDSDRHGCGTGLCIVIGGGDGFFLENALGKAAAAGKTISARLSSTAKEQTGLKAANGVATIPGKTKRTIIINAHADAWYTGADDNGGGVATTLALARYFAKKPKPEHTLVFVISAGHHTQGQGIPEFRKLHNNDYVANANLIINMEHVANTGLVRSMTTPSGNNFGRMMNATTAEWPKAVAVSNRAPFLMDIWRRGVTCFGLSLQRVVDTRAPGEPSVGYGDLKNVPITQMISVGPLYQTTGEVVDAIPTEGLERAARFYAYLIDASDKADPALLQGGAYTPKAGCPPTP